MILQVVGVCSTFQWVVAMPARCVHGRIDPIQSEFALEMHVGDVSLSVRSGPSHTGRVTGLRAIQLSILSQIRLLICLACAVA
jgi:hypothetical protein